MMKLKLAFVALLLSAATSLSGANKHTLTIDAKQSKEVTPVQYGLHYEEIGMIGEGALHAELVRNRSFEEATPPAGLAVKDGYYFGVPNPKGVNKEVFHVDPLIGWQTMPLSYSSIEVKLTKDSPIDKKLNPTSLLVDVVDDSTIENSTLYNRGYFGMSLKKGGKYNLSLFTRNKNYKGAFEIYLTDAAGAIISNKVVVRPAKEWSKSEGVLTAKADAARGMMAIRPLSVGAFQLDVVSLFPADTWDDGRSVFRADIVEQLKSLSPDFIRFPGGCIVHGVNEQTMYKWKKTIGGNEKRPGQWSKWEPYYRTDGIGYHEFYELCEYVGADAMYVISTGMICTGWVKQTAPWHHIQPEVNLDYYINDALDAIEYAIGDTSTKWGALRAKNGHAEPFPLKYVEIGNEDFGEVYRERYEKIYNALYAKYPQLTYIANSIIGESNDDKRGDIAKFPNPKNVKVFDEHYYQNVNWVTTEHDRFDNYPRGVADLFIGELGVGGRYPLNALGVAVFKLAMERNGDLNPLYAARPVMRHWDMFSHRNQPIMPMIINGNDYSIVTPLYHIFTLFNDNTIDSFLKCQMSAANGELFYTAGVDSQSGEYVIKIVNMSKKAQDIDIVFKGMKAPRKAKCYQMTLNESQRVTPSTPDAVEVSEKSAKLSNTQSIPAYSVSVYRCK